MRLPTLAECEAIASLITVVIVPGFVVATHAAVKFARWFAMFSARTPELWDDAASARILVIALKMELGADYLSRLVAALLPFSRASRETLNPTPSLERVEADQ